MFDSDILIDVCQMFYRDKHLNDVCEFTINKHFAQFQIRRIKVKRRDVHAPCTPSVNFLGLALIKSCPSNSR